MTAIACALAFWGALAFAGFVLWLRRTSANAEVWRRLEYEASARATTASALQRQIEALATPPASARVDVVAETLQQVAGRVERIERAMDL